MNYLIFNSIHAQRTYLWNTATFSTYPFPFWGGLYKCSVSKNSDDFFKKSLQTRFCLRLCHIFTLCAYQSWTDCLSDCHCHIIQRHYTYGLKLSMVLWLYMSTYRFWLLGRRTFYTCVQKNSFVFRLYIYVFMFKGMLVFVDTYRQDLNVRMKERINENAELHLGK